MLERFSQTLNSQKEFNRREFFRRVKKGAVTVGKVALVVELGPLLTACSVDKEERIDTPKRIITPRVHEWKNEERIRQPNEIGDGKYLFGEVVVRGIDKKQAIKSFSGEKEDFELPTVGVFRVGITPRSEARLKVDIEDRKTGWKKDLSVDIEEKEVDGNISVVGSFPIIFPPSLDWLRLASKIKPIEISAPNIKPKGFPHEFDFKTRYLTDGEMIDTGEGFYMVAQGRIYAVGNKAGSFFTVAKKNFPADTLEQFPLSENKFSFKEGDMLVSEGKAWYLRNGARYEMAGGLGIVRKMRFNGDVWELPKWVFGKIPIGEEKEPFTDWDGRRIDSPKEGDLKILFCGGLGSKKENQREVFTKLIGGLKKIGWKESQFLFLNLEDFNAYPPDNTDRISEVIENYAQNLPRSRFIMVGHSQGGYLGFHAALRHPEKICQVNTINSPLTGVDQVSLSLGPFEFDDLAFLRGCEEGFLGEACNAMQYYVALGNNPTIVENTEGWAKFLKEHGVEVFTFSAENDPLVKTDRAVLASSNDQVGDYKIKLVWRAPPPIRHASPHGSLVDYDEFVIEHTKSIGRAA